jgi:myo-inositol 2-dehydrogenase / D-chiro-inositol 1-dehydrogenase
VPADRLVTSVRIATKKLEDTVRDIGIGVIGSGFIADTHVEAFKHTPAASVRRVASPTPGNAAKLAKRHGIPFHHTDFRELLEHDDVDVVSVAAPNHFHRDIVVSAAQHGKHVICEKPLAPTLLQADEMIAACRDAGTMLMYAENLCFSPKYVRAKELVDIGALGDVFSVRLSEQHSGPHSPWFWDPELAGGGVVMDMGCHAIEFARWMYEKPPAESVIAELGTFVHAERTRAEDHAVAVVRFEGNRLGSLEVSWAKLGGMDDRAEVQGSGGVAYADLLRGSSIHTYSEQGYGYAVEKGAATAGWSYTMFEEQWNYGYPQEMRHFVKCILDDTEPIETGEDGRAVLEIMYAIYLAAGRGERVTLPLNLDAETMARPPHVLWEPPATTLRTTAREP